MNGTRTVRKGAKPRHSLRTRRKGAKPRHSLRTRRKTVKRNNSTQMKKRNNTKKKSRKQSGGLVGTMANVYSFNKFAMRQVMIRQMHKLIQIMNSWGEVKNQPKSSQENSVGGSPTRRRRHPSKPRNSPIREESPPPMPEESPEKDEPGAPVKTSPRESPKKESPKRTGEANAEDGVPGRYRVHLTGHKNKYLGLKVTKKLEKDSGTAGDSIKHGDIVYVERSGKDEKGNVRFYQTTFPAPKDGHPAGGWIDAESCEKLNKGGRRYYGDEAFSYARNIVAKNSIIGVDDRSAVSGEDGVIVLRRYKMFYYAVVELINHDGFLKSVRGRLARGLNIKKYNPKKHTEASEVSETITQLEKICDFLKNMDEATQESLTKETLKELSTAAGEDESVQTAREDKKDFLAYE